MSQNETSGTVAVDNQKIKTKRLTIKKSVKILLILQTCDRQSGKNKVE